MQPPDPSSSSTAAVPAEAESAPLAASETHATTPSPEGTSAITDDEIVENLDFLLLLELLMDYELLAED